MIFFAYEAGISGDTVHVTQQLLLLNLTVNLLRQMTVEEIYSYLVTTMFSIVAKVVLAADIVFLSSYSVIMWFLIRKKRDVFQGRHAQQKRFTNTITLCLGIVFVFILFTTPFAAVYLTTWDRPRWTRALSCSLFTLNPISNSLVYLIQTCRVRK